MSRIGLKRLRETLMGYVVVGVRGKNPERLVNLCLSNGFPVWDFVTRENEAVFSTSLSKYKQIRPLARKARCVPRVLKRVGLPFFLGRVRRRPSLLLAGAIVLATLIYLSGAVWSIRVTGAENVETHRILEVAENAGLRAGVRKSTVSTTEIETAIQSQLPELSWVYVHFQGTLAVVEVVEKTSYDVESPGDLVASKNGVIESVLVLSGTPSVTPGQTVQKGDLLIAGNPAEGSLRGGARGTVTALTCYESYLELPLKRVYPVRTGNKMEVKVVRYSGNEFYLTGRRNVFQWYEVEDYPLWRFGASKAGGPALEVFTRVFFEITWNESALTYEDAKGIAEMQAKESIQRRLPSAAKLVDLSCTTLPTDGQTVYIRVMASAVEDIGAVRPWPKADTEVSR